MAEWKLRDVRTALQDKGFELVRTTSHEQYRLFHNGMKTAILTHVSHGSGKICEGSKAFNGMKTQMRLNRLQLSRFIGCELTGEEYVGILESLEEL